MHKVGSFVLVLEGHPEATNDIDEDTAVSAALATLQSQAVQNHEALPTGLTLRSGHHGFGLTRVRTADGKETGTFGRPLDAWVLEFSAPPQQGWAHVSAFAVVDATNGHVVSASVDEHN